MTVCVKYGHCVADVTSLGCSFRISENQPVGQRLQSGLPPYFSIAFIYAMDGINARYQWHASGVTGWARGKGQG